MAGKMNNSMVVAMACLVALLQISSSAATTYTVGDTSGWTIMPYTSWLSGKSFKVNDVLVFTFSTGSHTVTEVSKSEYDACTANNPISQLTTGPASVTLKTSGTHYYICTISGHCGAGQKLAVVVAADSTSTPKSASPAPSTTPTAKSPSTSTTPTTATSPPTSAASPAPSTTPTAKSPSTSTAPSSTAKSPSTSTTPGSATSPSSSTTPAAPAPNSARALVAASGMVMPFLIVAAVFLF